MKKPPHHKETTDWRTIVIRRDSWETVLRGVEEIRKEADDPHMKEGRALELLVADWLSGR